MNPCTKGIYVWGTPLVMNGTSYLLIDTEGIGSVQETQTHDAKIFSLAILLSSYFIYNSVGVIDEHAIDRLSYDFLHSNNHQIYYKLIETHSSLLQHRGKTQLCGSIPKDVVGVARFLTSTGR